VQDRLTRFYRFLLWFGVIDCAIFGIGYYAAPIAFSEALGGPFPADPLAHATIGGFLLAALVAQALSLYSNKWSEVWVATYFLMTHNLLNGLRMLLAVTSGAAPPGLAPNIVLTLFFALTYGFVALQRRSAGQTVGSGTSA